VAQSTGELAVELRQVCVRFGAIEALHEVTLSIPRGASVAIVGPNGSGKSTLLGVLSGLIRPSSGSVTVLGCDPGRARQRVAHVLQSTAVRDEVPMTVTETVRLGTYARLGLFERAKSNSRDALDAAIKRLHLEDLRSRQLHELSGGQRQRVLIAQGLVQRADLLLLDEPVAGLDTPSQQIISQVIEEEGDRGTTVLISTHDIDAARRADLVILVATDVVAFGAAADVLTAEHLSAAFGGQVHALSDGTLVVDEPVHHTSGIQRTVAAGGQHYHDGPA